MGIPRGVHREIYTRVGIPRGVHREVYTRVVYLRCDGIYQGGIPQGVTGVPWWVYLRVVYTGVYLRVVYTGVYLRVERCTLPGYTTGYERGVHYPGIPLGVMRGVHYPGIPLGV